ncbi:carboxypeptidase regulatory-like domain-containing protein [Silvibacterium acidisoli]|uniref:carboxypeptidase regulatory-like domain-containing protein n=1 Tax=Acidobacteriaceae bacterium ZG23-2 TaxID=2883246 RepID=UPI00406C7E76
MRPYFLRKFSLVVCLFLACSACLAQAGHGGISGTVTDSAGAVVPSAFVELLETGTGVKQSTVTTSAGVYSFVSVAPGTYQLTVKHEGFTTAVDKNIVVTVDQTNHLNVTLSVGAVSQSVTVDDSTSLISTSSSTVGQLISSQTIDRVPLLTRDVYELVQLSTGVLPANGTPNSSSSGAIFNARSLIDVSSYTINGALQGSVYYVLDGSPIGVAENNIASILPAFQVPEDGVDEFRVETQNTPATYASGAAGVISLVTKSGTNKFHGDAFGVFRPAAVAANDYFYKQNNPGAPTPDFHRYQEGGAISGPIIKDKLFFFGDYEDTQQEQLEVGSYTVPTAAERTGDFSADNLTIYNPFAPDNPVANPDGSHNRQPFAGNIVPSSMFDPVAKYFADKLPLPNAPGDGSPYHRNNYSGSGLDPQNAHKFDVRIDYSPNQKQRIFARYSYGNLNFGNADLYGSSDEFDPYYYVNITKTHNVVLGDDITLSPTMVLSLRGSWTRHFENQTGDPRQNNFDISSVGFPQSLADQVVFKQAPVMTFETTSAVGGTTNEDTFIFASENRDFNVSLTKVLNKHEFTVGFDYEKKFANVGQPVAPAGTYGFDATATSSTTFADDGSDFASFLMGMGSAPGGEGGNFTKDIFSAQANPYYAPFVQDNYHITPKLTVNLGMRWEIFGSRTERFNRQEYFDPNVAYSVNGIALTGGEVFADSNHRTPFTTRLTNFAPRVGFSWQLQDSTVVRGGAGIYYGPAVTQAANPGFNSDGFSSSTSWNATTTNDDGNSIMLNPLSNPFPSGVVQPIGSSQGAATNIGVGLTTVQHDPKILTTYNYNIGIEQQLPGKTVFSLAYVGSHGLFLPLGSVDLNTFSIETIAKYGGTLCNNNSTGCVLVPNKWESILPPTSLYYGSDTVPLWVSLEPYPQFNSGGFGSGVTINGYNGANSQYNSLQTKLEKHMDHGVSTIASLTWAKLLTTDSQSPLGFVGFHSAGPQDWRDLNLERAVSSQDVKVQFNWQTSWDLPFGKDKLVPLHGVVNQALGNWSLNTILYWSTGVPIAVPTGTGDQWFNQRVDQTCSPKVTHNPLQWFNYNCFSQPDSDFRPGSSPAYMSNVRTDGAHSLDVSVYKNFPLGGERNIRLEVASYNVTNTVQFGYPNVFWNQNAKDNPDVMQGFGQIYGASNLPRQFQFGGRFTF